MLIISQCESYMRLVREALANEEGAANRALDVDSIADMDDEDKTYAAMGVAKTISTVTPATLTARERLLNTISGCIIR
jgi:importin-7